ncbi:MAG: GNAT family N-acetyltransferase [Angelakisella sp.]
MLFRVDGHREGDFVAVSACDPVFGSKSVTALLAYGTGCYNPSFWLAYTAQGVPTAALYLSGHVLTLSGQGDTAELAEFIRSHGVTEVDTNWEQCDRLMSVLGGVCESSFYMAYDGEPIAGDYSDIQPADNLREVFSVLQQSHEYYRTHLTFECWSQEIALKLDKGLMELVILRDETGVPIGTGSVASEDAKSGAIAAVAVIPTHRGRLLGTKISSYLVNRVLEKGKQPVLISGYDAVAQLYRKVGFHETGRWGELYL